MNVDFKAISQTWGYKRLKAAVLSDIAQDMKRRTASGERCSFHPMGCIHTGRTICVHKYCSKFRWAIDRARHYSYKTGLTVAEIINAWEKDRSYWYMNYYQNSNHPKLYGDNIYVYATLEEMSIKIGTEFRCPRCGGITTNPYRCNSGRPVKGTKSGICDWAVYGLFQDMGKGIYVYVKEKARGERMFMPLVFEKQHVQ